MKHHYSVSLEWTGNNGRGTLNYDSYSRNHLIGKGTSVKIPGSSDKMYRGDPDRYNPEETLISSLSACHMLWFLHLCSEAGIIVQSYSDQAIGTMSTNSDGSGQFTEVTLKPLVGIQGEYSTEKLTSIHKQANKMCFIARSVNFPVNHDAKVLSA